MMTNKGIENNHFKRHEPIISVDHNTKTVSSRQSNKGKKTNICITNNLMYGDTLQTTTGSFTRILGQNKKRDRILTFYNTIDLVFDSMRKFNIDVAGLSETNLHFNILKVNKSMQKIIRKFWSRDKLTTSEKALTWQSNTNQVKLPR